MCTVKVKTSEKELNFPYFQKEITYNEAECVSGTTYAFGNPIGGEYGKIYNYGIAGHEATIFLWIFYFIIFTSVIWAPFLIFKFRIFKTNTELEDVFEEECNDSKYLAHNSQSFYPRFRKYDIRETGTTMIGYDIPKTNTALY